MMRRLRRIVSFPYYGGKNRHLNWILPRLPNSRTYIEPFGGSAAVLLNKTPRSPIEVFNDIDDEIVHFFQMLREHGDELIGKLSLTLHARQEFVLATQFTEDPIERARRFYVRICQSFARRSSKVRASNWSVSAKQIRGSVAKSVGDWLLRTKHLPYVVERFKAVIIEHKNAVEVIEKYDTKDAVIYCDPPYVAETRVSKREYQYEMTEFQHRILLRTILDCDARVAITGYRCPLYDSMLQDWHRSDITLKSYLTGVSKIESLWTNYDPDKVYNEQSMQVRLAEFLEGEE